MCEVRADSGAGDSVPDLQSDEHYRNRLVKLTLISLMRSSQDVQLYLPFPNTRLMVMIVSNYRPRFEPASALLFVSYLLCSTCLMGGRRATSHSEQCRVPRK